MKKRIFTAADVFIIVVLIACVTGIFARAIKLNGAKAVKYEDYRVRFSARLDPGKLDGISSGVRFTDKNKAEFVLLEGYWITENEDFAVVNGEFLLTGRMTEKGFECGDGYYYENDVISLKSSKLDLEATLTGFTSQ